MAEQFGHTDAIAPLQQSLAEEQSMAQWIDSNVKHVTQEYVRLLQSGQEADR